jgi:hypothetical protein
MLGFTPLTATPIADETITTYVVITASLVGTGVVGGGTAVITDQVLAQSGLSATCINGVVAINTGAGAVINAGASVGTSAVGGVTVVNGTGISVNVVGVYGQTVLNGGAVVVEGNSTAPTTGLVATTAISGVTQRTTAVIPITNMPGATGIVDGGTTVIGDSTTGTLTGVEATTSVGTVLVWGEIVPEPNTIWTPIAA